MGLCSATLQGAIGKNETEPGKHQKLFKFAIPNVGGAK
jgi:hypothetical protein